MSIKMGHEFHAEHGFTGSAHPGKTMKPKIHGYKHGGEEHAEGAKEHHGKHGHQDHDGEMHQSKVKYDEHGFQTHVGHKGHAGFKHGGMC